MPLFFYRLYEKHPARIIAVGLLALAIFITYISFVTVSKQFNVMTSIIMVVIFWFIMVIGCSRLQIPNRNHDYSLFEEIFAEMVMDTHAERIFLLKLWGIRNNGYRRFSCGLVLYLVIKPIQKVFNIVLRKIRRYTQR